MLLRRVSNLFRYTTSSYPLSKQQKARLKQKKQQDARNIWKKYRPNIADFKNWPALNNLLENKDDFVYLQKSEIQTRILKRLYQTQLVDINKFTFQQDLINDLKLDSLNIIIILTQIQHQFTTVLQDRVFQSVRNLKDLVQLLGRDHKIF